MNCYRNCRVYARHVERRRVPWEPFIGTRVNTDVSLSRQGENELLENVTRLLGSIQSEFQVCFEVEEIDKHVYYDNYKRCSPNLRHTFSTLL